MSEPLPPCVLCGRPLTAVGEMQDMVCAGRTGEDVSLSCTIRLQRWLETSMFAETFAQDRAQMDAEDWNTVSWRVALDYWQERGGLPPVESGRPDPLLEAA